MPTNYELVARDADAVVLPGVRSPIWGYEGAFPGPTVEARAGPEVRLRYRNELPVPTVLHLHGGHTPAESDGYPADLLLPAGRTWRAHHLYDPAAQLTVGEREYRYPMRQRAATLGLVRCPTDAAAPVEPTPRRPPSSRPGRPA